MSRDETVTNRNPKTTIITAPDDPAGRCRSGIRCVAAIAATSADRAEADEPERQVALGPAGSPRRLAPTVPRSRSPDRSEPTISGRAWSRLIIPPVATAPAPM